jgi:hypothetical protein
MAEQNVPPFSSYEVAFIEKHNPPNWNNLPRELEYLKDIAEVYGVYYSGSDMLKFLDQASEKDMEILSSTAEKIRLNGHAKMINEWIDQFDMVKHTEASMVYCLLGVMDQAGLQFDE